MREDVDAKLLFKKIIRTSRNNVIIEHLNINTIRNKFDLLKEIVSNNIDILVISETKLDSSFSSSQFYIEDCVSFIRADRNRHGGGFLVYVTLGR